MIESISILDAHYTSLQEGWTVEDGVSDYASLVTPTGNSAEPFHRWFHFKEGYSHALVERVFKDASYSPTDSLSVIDPFAGSGTTLLSALAVARRQELAAQLIGVERNPVMQLIAGAKLNAALHGSSLASLTSNAAAQFWSDFHDIQDQGSDLVTESVTLNNADYYRPDDVRALLALGRAAKRADDDTVRQVLLATVAATVEPSGKVRRDGRALRHHPTKTIKDPVTTFQTLLAKAIADMESTEPTSIGPASVLLGDARSLSDVDFRSFDWSIFSPPYPNNIDYTEVYKTEAWALELFATKADMRDQRLRTLRSHPSITFPDTYTYTSDDELKQPVGELIDPIVDAIPEDRYAGGRNQLIRGYADDMLQVLQQTRALMSAGGRAAIIVGNSAHGHKPHQFVVAADLMIARLAELAGWRVELIRIARRPNRRDVDGTWLRESLVMLVNDAGP